MRRVFLIILFLTGLFVTGHGQDMSDARNKQEVPVAKPVARPLGNVNVRVVPNRLKRIEDIKSKFIAAKLNLTPAEAEKFWPIWYEYQAELLAVQQQIRLNNSAATSNGADQVQNEIMLDRKRADIRMHYNTEFQKILPIEKVSQIYKSEKEFNDEMIKAMRERKSVGEN